MSQTRSSRAGLARLRTTHLFLLLPWIAVVVAARQPIRDNSFLWHVRAGTLQLDAGEVLRTDPFSFTFGGSPWRTQSWLVDLLYGVLERQFGHGLAWVSWMNIAVFGLTLLIAALVLWRSTRSVPATAAVLFLLGWLIVPYVNPRPVAFSYLLLVALMATLELRWRWAVPLLIWIWAALHGSFVLGIGLVVLEALRLRDRNWVRPIVLSALAASLTAHGLALWQVLARFSQSREALDLITEWQPPNLTNIATLPYAVFILLVLVGATRGVITPRDLWVVAPFLLFGLTSGRAVIVGALVISPFVVRALLDLAPGPGRSERTDGPPPLVVMLVGAAIVVLPFFLSARAEILDESRFPVAAAEFLAPVPTFHTDVDGGYLIYARWPEQPIFTDDRAELFGGEFFRAFVDARGAVPGWDDVFAQWEIEQVLLRTDDPLAGVLEARSDWSTVHRDTDHVVFALRR